MVLAPESWEATLLCVTASISAMASLVTMITFARFPFLREYPRDMYLQYTVLDFVGGVCVAFVFGVNDLDCADDYISAVVFFWYVLRERERDDAAAAAFSASHA